MTCPVAPASVHARRRLRCGRRCAVCASGHPWPASPMQFAVVRCGLMVWLPFFTHGDRSSMTCPVTPASVHARRRLRCGRQNAVRASGHPWPASPMQIAVTRCGLMVWLPFSTHGDRSSMTCPVTPASVHARRRLRCGRQIRRPRVGPSMARVANADCCRQVRAHGVAAFFHARGHVFHDVPRDARVGTCPTQASLRTAMRRPRVGPSMARVANAVCCRQVRAHGVAPLKSMNGGVGPRRSRQEASRLFGCSLSMN